jgi:hypothetical protein
MFPSTFQQLEAARAGARERVVPISELVFGTLTQNRSSLEPSLEFAAIVDPRRIVDRARYVQAAEEPKRDPKRLWRIRPDVNVVPAPPPIRKINSRSQCSVLAIAANSREGSRLLRFWVKVPNTNSEIGTQVASRAPARAA